LQAVVERLELLTITFIQVAVVLVVFVQLSLQQVAVVR
jgi:hypothetical protein